MKQILKRALALILTVIMLAGTMTLFSCGTSGDKHESDEPQNIPTIPSIEEQIRAFARSIDKSNANYSAAMALAKHGTTGDGKKLSVNQSHPLTATLMNAELSLTTIIHGCTVAIEKMKELHLSSIFGDAGCYFGMNDTCYNVAALYREGDDDGIGTDVLRVTKLMDYDQTLNAYDSSLVWIAGSTEIHIYITQTNTTATTITYSVKVVFADDFNFNTSEGSLVREIASFLGSALFEDFRWTATVEFPLILPNDVHFSPGNGNN